MLDPHFSRPLRLSPLLALALGLVLLASCESNSGSGALLFDPNDPDYDPSTSADGSGNDDDEGNDEDGNSQDDNGNDHNDGDDNDDDDDWWDDEDDEDDHNGDDEDDHNDDEDDEDEDELSPWSDTYFGYVALVDVDPAWGDGEYCDGELMLEISEYGELSGAGVCSLGWGGGWGEEDGDDTPGGGGSGGVQLLFSGYVDHDGSAWGEVEHVLPWGGSDEIVAEFEGSFENDGWFLDWEAEVEIGWSERDVQGFAESD